MGTNRMRTGRSDADLEQLEGSCDRASTHSLVNFEFPGLCPREQGLRSFEGSSVLTSVVKTRRA